MWDPEPETLSLSSFHRIADSDCLVHCLLLENVKKAFPLPLDVSVGQRVDGICSCQKVLG